MSTTELLAALSWFGAAFVMGTGYGLWLNVTLPVRMRHWAARVVERQEEAKEAERVS